TTLLIALALTVGTWVLTGNSEALLASWLPSGVHAVAEPLLKYGLTPPMPLIVLAFGFDTYLDAPDRFLGESSVSTGQMLVSALGGPAFYAGAAALLWWAALARFRPQPCRAPVRYR